MYVGQEFSDVSPAETVDFWFDYYRDLLATETIASAVFTLSVLETAAGATADADPNGKKSGAATVASSFVNTTLAQRPVQRVVGLVAGNKYLIACAATTSVGQVLQLHSRFWCRAAA